MRRNTDNCDEWSNFETWTMRKWMVNEPENMETWRDDIEGLLDDPALASDRAMLCKALAREIQREAEAYCCSFGGDLAADLIEAALSHVDWLELADELLADLRPTQVE